MREPFFFKLNYFLQFDVVDVSLSEKGLELAHRCTEALYSKNPEVALSQLSRDELASLFSNASSCELFLDPGTTLFDVVMRAKCFRHESTKFSAFFIA